MRYWYHPESSCVWAQDELDPENAEAADFDLIVELTEEEYNEKLRQQDSLGGKGAR